MREHPHPFRSCNRHHRSTSETGWSPFRRGRIGADSASVLILNRRKRAPNLRVSDRIIAGLCTLLMRPARVLRFAIVLRPSTLLHFHHALTKRKYRILFSPKCRLSRNPRNGASILAVPRLNLLCSAEGGKARPPKFLADLTRPENPTVRPLPGWLRFPQPEAIPLPVPGV